MKKFPNTNGALAKAMREHGYSTRQLARVSGVPQATVWRMLRGVGSSRPQARLRVAMALGRHVDDLFGPELRRGAA